MIDTMMGKGKVSHHKIDSIYLKKILQQPTNSTTTNYYYNFD